MKIQAAAPKKILIVDDDADVRRLLLRVFRDAYRARQTGNGRRALEMTARDRFDLVLLDVVMPGMNGLDVLEILKTASPDLPVVMLTGIADIDVVVRALDMGAKAYVTKPFVVAEIKGVLGGLLDRPGRDGRSDARPWRVAGEPQADRAPSFPSDS